MPLSKVNSNKTTIMKQSSIIILLTMFMNMVSTKAVAHDIEVKNSDGITIYYNWINDHQNLSVTFQGSKINSMIYSGSVVIPGSIEYEGETYNVTEIGDNAFYMCKNLTSLTIPTNVTSIGLDAFLGCSNLLSVHISDIAAWCNIKFSYYFHENDDGNRIYHYSNPLMCAKQLYLNGEEITDLVIPNGVTAICGAAFKGFIGLTSVTIPNSVTSIDDSAFSGCTSLTEVTIGNGVTYIGGRAFDGCTDINAVFISDLAAWCNISFGTHIVAAYDDCASNPLMYAKHLYLNGEEITDLTIPYGVTAIKKYAFRYFSGLTSVTIPNSVTEIGLRAFQDCTNLMTITIGSGVTSIGGWAFAKVKGIFFSRTRTDNDVYKVFCKAESVPETASNAFENCQIDQGLLIVPDNAVAAYQAVAPWNGFGNISGETEYLGIEGIHMNSVNARIYDLQGNHLENLHKGVNIIKMNNSPIKKVFVK